jgi:hypothetical protein
MLEQALLYNSMVELAESALSDVKTWGVLRQRIAEFKKKAIDANFPDLMTLVNKGLTSPLHFEKEFLTLQKVRNCLEHRGGVVGDKDVDDTQALRLALPRVKVLAVRDAREVELVKGSYVEKDSSIEFRNVIEERVFKLGERVVFKAEEFNEIGYGCWMFTSDLATKLPKLEEQKNNVP